MLKLVTKKILYGILVLLGVIVLVFFLFQGFGDASKLVGGQSSDSATQANIRKELHLDEPVLKQFVYYINDVSPICFHSSDAIKNKRDVRYMLTESVWNKIQEMHFYEKI